MSHGARSHAKYSASNARRFMSCAGQVALTSKLPARDSDFSAEGTAFHELLERSFKDLPMMWQHGADPEMIEAVEVVHDWLESLYIGRGRQLVMSVEQPAAFPQNCLPRQDVVGVPDITLYDPLAAEAWSVDVKYGAGVVVEPEQNEQLLFNACCAFWDKPLSKLNCVIIQPRVKHHPRGVVREWSCSPVDLVDFRARVLLAIEAAENAEHHAANRRAPLEEYLTPGAWCRFCAAEAWCPAKQKSALALAYEEHVEPRDLEGRAPPDPKTLGLDRIAYILRHADMLRSWLNAVENEAKDLANRGIVINGFKLVEAQARRVWDGEPSQIAAALCEATGLPLDKFFPRTLIGVGEAEAEVVAAARAKAPKGEKDKAAREARERMAFLTLKRSSGNLVLVPETDKRPAADRASVAFHGVVIPAIPQ